MAKKRSSKKPDKKPDKAKATKVTKSRLEQALERHPQESGGKEGAGAAGTNQEFLCVGIASHRYAFETRDVIEVIPPGSVTQVPHTPEYIEGLIARHGRVTAVLNLAAYRGISSGADVVRMVVVQTGDLEAAIPVHEVFGIVTVSGEQVESLWGKATADGEYVVGQLSLDEGIHSIIDVEKLLQGSRHRR